MQVAHPKFKAGFTHRAVRTASLPWMTFVVVLLAAPLVLDGGVSLTVLSQIGTIAIFGLAYNMLLGQSGMLSFGHAVYSGLGGFLAAHAMNLAASGAISLPLPLVPLVGGVAGLLACAVLGYVSTRGSGTAFSMITLGILELAFAACLMFPGIFGGEGGIATNRVYGSPLMGLTFGPQRQVYYLVAAWLLASAVAMYAFTRSPLGKIMNAVRDNPERVEFIGYDARWAGYLTLTISSFFAGISGALAAINFEIVSAESVSMARSGAILLFTFIGGIGFFFGPVIGCTIGVAATVLLSEYTQAWQLYLGLFFIAVVIYAPGGVAGTLAAAARLLKQARWPILGPLLGFSVACGLCGASLIAIIESTYRIALDPSAGLQIKIFGLTLNAGQPSAWVAMVAIFTVAALVASCARARMVATIETARDSDPVRAGGQHE